MLPCVVHFSMDVNAMLLCFHFLPKNGFLYIKNIFYILNKVYSDRSELNQNLKFRFQSKVMMKKLLKITELLRFRKAHSFQATKDIDSEF